MGLSIRDRILLWILAPVLVAVAVVAAPELLGLAAGVAEDVAAAEVKKRVREELEGA